MSSTAYEVLQKARIEAARDLTIAILPEIGAENRSDVEELATVASRAYGVLFNSIAEVTSTRK
jgi:hypothetical protein